MKEVTKKVTTYTSNFGEGKRTLALSEKVYFLFIFVLAIILGVVFSGIHTFFCFSLGLLWSYYLCSDDGQKDHILWGKWKMSYNRYSFVRFIKNIDERLNQYFNPKHLPLVASFFRILTAPLLFAILGSLLPFYVEWYFILLGELAFELPYLYRKGSFLKPVKDSRR